MANASDIRAGAAYVELYTKDNRLVRGLENAQRRLMQFQQRVGDTGKKLAQLATVASIPAAIGLGVFARFEDELAKVGSFSKATSQELKELTETARNLGKTTSFMASQVAQGMTELARSGFNPEQIKAIIPGMLNLARATDTDLADAAQIASNQINAFNLSATDMTRVADVLTATVNGSAQTLMDLQEAMKLIAPQAVQAGTEIEEVAAAVGILANNGIRGSLAGTAIRQMLIRLGGDSEKLKASLNVSTKDAAGNLRPFTTVINEIGAAVKNMGNGDRLAVLTDLFGDRASGPLSVLIKSSEELQEFQKSLGNIEMTAAMVAAAMDNTLGGAFRLFLSVTEAVSLTIGEQLAPTVMAFMKTRVIPLLAALEDWISKNKETVVAIAAVVAGIGTLGVAMIAWATALKAASFVLGSMITTLKIMSSAVMVSVGILKTVTAIIMFLASPLTLVITLFSAVGVAVLHYSGVMAQATQWLGERFSAFATTAKAAWGSIVKAMEAGDFGLAAEIAMGTLKVAWLEAINVLQTAWHTFAGWFSSLTQDIVLGVVELFIKGAARIGIAWDTLVYYLSSLWEKFKNGIVDSWNWVQDQLTASVLIITGNSDALGELYDEIDKREAKLANNRSTKAGELEQRFRDAVAMEDGIQNDRLTQLGQIGNAMDDERAHAAELRKKEAQKAINEARNNLAKLALKADALDAGEKTDSPLGKLQEKMAAITNVDIPAIRRQTTGLDVSTFFGGGRLDRIGVGTTAMDRTANAAESIAKTSKETAANTRDATPTFT